MIRLIMRCEQILTAVIKQCEIEFTAKYGNKY